MAYEGFDLTGKTAVITGGNGGIGLGLSRLNRPIRFDHFLDLSDWPQTPRESVS